MTPWIVGLLQRVLHIATNTCPLEKPIGQMKVFLDVRYPWNWLYQYSIGLTNSMHTKSFVLTLSVAF